MIKEIKDQWVEALCQRYYQKCHSALHIGSRFSTFGVLCDLFLRSMDQPWGPTNQQCLGCSIELPLNVARWADGEPILLVNHDTIKEGPIVDSIYWQVERELIKGYELKLSFTNIASKIDEWEESDDEEYDDDHDCAGEVLDGN